MARVAPQVWTDETDMGVCFSSRRQSVQEAEKWFHFSSSRGSVSSLSNPLPSIHFCSKALSAHMSAAQCSRAAELLSSNISISMLLSYTLGLAA
eukprot:142691-Pelagomonas_calceolata.AAC.8